MSCCDICDELAQIKAEQAWEREALTLLLLHAGLQVPGGGTPPTSEYWNPADKGAAIVLSNSDKTAADPTESEGSVRSVTSHGTGKYAFKLVDSTGGSSIGFANATESMSSGIGNTADSLSFSTSGSIVENGVDTPYGTGWAATDEVVFALDLDNSLLYISVNGTWEAGADPVAGTGGYNYSVTGDIYAACSPYLSETTLGTSSSDLTPPTGYTAWG